MHCLCVCTGTPACISGPTRCAGSKRLPRSTGRRGATAPRSPSSSPSSSGISRGRSSSSSRLCETSGVHEGAKAAAASAAAKAAAKAALPQTAPCSSRSTWIRTVRCYRGRRRDGGGGLREVCRRERECLSKICFCKPVHGCSPQMCCRRASRPRPPRPRPPPPSYPVHQIHCVRVGLPPDIDTDIDPEPKPPAKPPAFGAPTAAAAAAAAASSPSGSCLPSPSFTSPPPDWPFIPPTIDASRWRGCHSTATTSPLGRCFNMDGEGVAVNVTVLSTASRRTATQ